MDRTKYKNEHAKNKYDKLNVVLPKGEKGRVAAAAGQLGVSMSEYVYMLISRDLVTGSSNIAAHTEKFTEEQYELLEKWQVSRKYYEMIENISYSKTEGYFIMLKSGYTNDVTGSRIITAEKTAEMRGKINKSRKI